jgi:restriction system protein
VELLTWKEFQGKFFESWFEEFFIVKMTNGLDPLLSYTEPILPRWFNDMSSEDKAKYYSLKDEYDILGYIIMVLFSAFSRTLVKREIPKLPLIDLVKDPSQIEKKIPADILNETGYKEFLAKTIEFGKIAIAKFRELRDKYKDTVADE